MKNACGGFYFVGCNAAQKKMQKTGACEKTAQA